MNPQELQEIVDKRLQTMRILWFAMCMSILFYYGFTLLSHRSEDLGPNNLLFYVLLIASASVTIQSFIIKRALLKRAFLKHDVQMVQQAYLVAWAVSEVGGLLGLVVFFTTNSPYYYILMALGLLAQLLHTPRRDDIAQAAFKGNTF